MPICRSSCRRRPANWTRCRRWRPWARWTRCTARRSRSSTWRIVLTRRLPKFWKCPSAPSSPAWPADWRNSNTSSPGAARPGTHREVNMNNLEAREILALFRPGTADEKDPSFGETRQLARTDPELARWFDQHCEAYLVLRGKFQAIPIPRGLKEQILSERKIQRPLFQRYW